MIRRPPQAAHQRGVIMISAILLLAVVTIFAMTMFRSFGIEEKIASNVRDKERAMHSAMAALQYAEWWVSQPGNGISSQSCTGGLTQVSLNNTHLCNPASALTLLVPGGDLTNVPWMTGGGEIGSLYDTSGMPTNHTPGSNSYYEAPRFYVQYIGHVKALVCGNIYLIDAWGYGGSRSSIAVVESTYQIYFNDCSGEGS